MTKCPFRPDIKFCSRECQTCTIYQKNLKQTLNAYTGTFTICPNCHTPNNPKTIFCEKCHFRLVESYG